MKFRFLLVLGTLCLLNSCSSVTVAPDNYAEPPSFTSANHLLDLVVVARPAAIELGGYKPTAWVFAMCEASVAQGDDCPADARTVAPYGGIRLQVYPGDHLRMRLVNHLPPAPADAENANGSDPMMNEMLVGNPVNIHTHGLIVEPRKADASDPSYGDYVYVLGYPAGKLPAMAMADETITDKPIQYDIYIPEGHPSGLFWFHPHVHGLGVNQLSEGLSGMITVGSVTDYVGNVDPQAVNLPVRYVVLKDMQVLVNGDAHDQESAEFCAVKAQPGENRDGGCDGQNATSGENVGDDFTGGRWFFTLNGQVFPSMSVDRKTGEMWRMLNSGPTRSYDLVLLDDKTGAEVPFQVISLDGVALAPPAGSTSSQIRAWTGGKVDAVPCAAGSNAVCATHLVMMPSSRAEIWMAGTAATTSATLVTRSLNTGPDGDDWPEARLARVSFHGTASQGTAAG